jgi:hypothetical protein
MSASMTSSMCRYSVGKWDKHGPTDTRPARLCLALGQERFDGLVKRALPVLDLLITEECHRIPHEVLLFCDAPTRAEVQKGIGRCLRGFRRDHSVLASHRAIASLLVGSLVCRID